MPSNRIEYLFYLDAFTPETIPQGRLGEYLTELAKLYGEETAIHFVRLKEGSVGVVSAIDADAELDVQDRVQNADTDSASAETKAAFQALSRKIAEDGGKACYIAKQDTPILRFPSGERVNEPLEFGPFWQQGHLSGTVILLGGKTERVSVKIQDANGDSHTCKADRATAKRLRDYLYEQPIRVIGQGRWRRERNGRWRLEEFAISDFAPLDDEPLTDTVAQLRAVDAKWKDRPDPLSEIERLRRGQ